eukprot:CFRG8237T1
MRFIEQKNKSRLGIQHQAMSCDEPMQGIPDPLPHSNIFFCLVGPPGSGKTNVMLNLLTVRKKFYYQKFDKVYIFSPSLHTVNKSIGVPKDQLRDSLESFPALYDEILAKKKMRPTFRACIVIDDMTHEFSKQNNIPQLVKACQNRRHAGISIIMITQRLNKVPAEIRAHISDLVWFYTHSMMEQNILRNEFCDLDKNDWRELMQHTFRDAHDFLYCKSDGRKFRNFDTLIES